MTDQHRGIYRKFHVERTDGSSAPGGKHEHCRYFVLDIDHDVYVVVALVAYAADCREKHPELARDLDTMVEQLKVIAALRSHAEADGAKKARRET